MNIVLVTIGSRGDVQPMVALSLAFKSAGHSTVLVGPPERASWASALGCDYLAFGSDVTAFLDSLDNAYTLTSATRFMPLVRRMVIEQFEKLPPIVKGADLVVGASLSFALSTIAEASSIPYRFVALTPQLIPSSRHPCPLLKNNSFPGWWNRLGWRAFLFFDRFNLTGLINRHRRPLGLRPLSHAWYHILGSNLIVATDSQIVQLPTDDANLATPGGGLFHGIQTGYMHLRQPRCDLPQLEAFLSAGEPPVYAGFGSMPRCDQERLFPLIKAAAHHAGRRLVLARFWQEESEMDREGDVFYISRFPHDQLFPHMAAVIHHGGAGTTATAALCGAAQIIVPHVLDQFYWGRRVFLAGLGPRPLPRARLSARRLGRAIQAAVDNPGVTERAKAVQLRIQETDGAGNAVTAILDGL